MAHDGGCLCGALRYRVTTDPLWVTVCSCTFCQRATGTTGMVEPIFDIANFEIIKGVPKVYTQQSAGSGKDVHVHFCDTCGTKSHLTFERWPDRLGVYSGSFDDPGWFDFTPENSKYIFVDEAARGTVIPPKFKYYARHAAERDGTPIDPTVLDDFLHIR